MLVTRKILLGMVLVLLLAYIGPVLAQSGKSFTGKITEIAKGTELDLYKKDTFYILRLEEFPQIQFRLSPAEAVRSGVIEGTGNTEILTPKMTKGLGWKVRLTCDPKPTGELKTPVYKVLSLKRLDG